MFPVTDRIVALFMDTFHRLIGDSTADLKDVAEFALEKARELAEHTQDADYQEQLRLTAETVALHGSNKLTDLADDSDRAVQHTLMTALDWATKFAVAAIP